MVILLLGFVGLFSAGVAFYCLYPAFGGRTPRQHKQRSKQFDGRKFVNAVPTPMNMSLVEFGSIIVDSLRKNQHRRPSQPLVPDTYVALSRPPADLQVTWFGHSAFLLEVHGRRILLDPMFGTSPSPFPAITPKRFSKQLPIQPEDLPAIDVVLISHDHYDHLDYPSIKRLHTKVGRFFVPIGLGAHLRRWGVPANKIQEFDWHESQTIHDITFVCTPSRHFSGRTLTDRFATLWASWVIDAGQNKIFFSGDTGYGPHFAQIGKQYGPFDLTLMECGQYDRRWETIHMTPEQTVQAHQDLRGKIMIPMHWGAFVLALHSWTEPVERALAAAKQAKVTLCMPKIGETVTFGKRTPSTGPWWRTVQDQANTKDILPV